HTADGWLLWLLFLSSISAALAISLACRLWTGRKNLIPAGRLSLMVAIIGLFFTVAAGPAYWMPTYEKLWLQPVATVIAAIGIGLWLVPVSRTKRLLLVGAGLLLMIEIVCNCLWVIPQANGEIISLREAGQVNDLVGPDDFVVCEWDRVSVM